MKAPDKIYVAVYPNYDLDGEHLADDWTDHPVQDCENIAYIRKNALLDWAKEMLVCFTPGFDCHETLKMVINHIESL